MAISLALVDFDKTFRELKTPPIIINDVVEASITEREKLQSLITTRYDSDLLKNLPSCDCGALTDQHNVGIICNVCSTPVTNRTETELEPIIWVRKPENVLALVNPEIWIMLTERFKKSSFSALQYLTDTTYKVSPKDQYLVIELQSLGIERGYNNFIANFEEIFDKLSTLNRYAYKNKNEFDPLKQLLIDNRDKIFCSYLPLVNRTLLVIESTHVGSYVDPYIPTAVDSMLLMSSIDTDGRFTQKVKENRTAKFMVGQAKMYSDFIKSNLGSKPGAFRQHVYGGRSNFGFRAVVTSITDAHEYDEIHVPWSIAVAVLRYHIANKLTKRGYSVNQVIDILNKYAKRYNPLLDEIFQELIDESPRKGIDVTLNRNPSLNRGSIQRVRITKIKKDPAITTVSFSILIVTPLNADFDGDALNFTLILDNEMSSDFSHLDPHKSCFELDDPRAISGNLSIPKTAIATMSNWIHAKIYEENTPFMQSISLQS